MPSHTPKLLRSRARCTGLAVLLLALFTGVAARAELVVVWTGKAAARADLRVGDIVTGTGDPAVALATPDALWQQLHGPGRRSSLTLHGRRAEQAMSWRLPAGTTDVHVLPQSGRARWQALERLDRALDAGTSPPDPSASVGLIETLLVSARLNAAGDPDAARRWLAAWDTQDPQETLAALVWRLRRGTGHLANGEALLARGVLAGTRAPADPHVDQRVLLAHIDVALGDVARRLGELDGAEAHYDTAMARVADIAPLAPVVTDAARNLGNVYAMRGNMTEAAVRYRRALSIATRSDNDIGRARVLNNLGIVAARQGDIAGAERYYRDSLDANERLGRWRSFAINLYNLADLAYARADYDAAIELLLQALQRFERDEPDGFAVLQTKVSLAGAYLEIDRLDEAQRLYSDALVRYRERAPGNEQVAMVLLGLGDTAMRRGQLDDAVEHFVQAVDLRNLLAPDSVGTAEARQYLAEALIQDGHREDAYAQLDKAAHIYMQKAPLSVAYAQTLHALGRWHHAGGATNLAIANMLKAIDVLDGQTRQLGGEDDVRALFADRYAPVYKDLIALLMDAGRQEDAFDVLERYRARSLLSLLAQREQSFAAGARDGNARTTLRAAMAATPDDTLVLSYSIGEHRSFVLAMTREHFESFELPLGAEPLRERVLRLRTLIHTGREDPQPQRPLIATATELFDVLVRPALRRFDAKRLLVVPDGSLHHLPFGALVSSSQDQPIRFAVEQWPIRRTLSLTLNGADTDACPAGDCASSAEPTIIAFAAPDAGTVPLPFAGDELDAIEREFAGRVERYEQQDATEQNLRSAARRANILHIASHGMLAPGLPLDSALALTPDPSRDDGQLQVWEIFDAVRTDASLVVLSACDSARGMETAGDGLIGLARAFHFAGAGSVIATQWPVTDRASALLVGDFYRALRAGQSYDAALRTAQLARLRGARATSIWQRWFGSNDQARFSAPYYWAGFELSTGGAPATAATKAN